MTPTHTPRTPRLALALLTLTLTLPAAALHAQPANVPLQANPDTVALAPRDILTRLDDPDWNVRETATRELLADTRITPQRLAELFEQAATLEQLQRLLEVARHRFLERLIRENYAWEGDGSIGIIQRETEPVEIEGQTRAAIVVIRTLPGFPGHEALREGDLVVQVAGDWFDEGSTMEDFQQRTRALPPGSILTLTVLRRGQPLNLTVETAPLTALQTTYEAPSFGLTDGPRQLWQAEQQRLTSLAPTPLTPAPDFQLQPLDPSSL